MLSRLPVSLLAVVLTAAALTAGCGGADEVSRDSLEQQVQEGLTKSVGQKAPKASCPDALEAEVGATTRCTMDFPEGKRLGISVKVKSVDGDDARFDIKADEKLTETP